MNDLSIRLMEVSELPYVKSTWLKHYKEHSEFARPIRYSVYYPAHSKIVDRILSKPQTLCVIATHIDEPEVILGFLVFERLNPIVVHYAYVVSRARGLGVAKAMMKETQIGEAFTFTHRTTDAKTIQAKYANLTYDPYNL